MKLNTFQLPPLFLVLLLATLWPGQVTLAADRGPLKGVVILVQFPDVRHQVNRAAVHRRFNSDLNTYIREMSYGRVSLDVDVTKDWYTMPDPIGQYSISPRNLEVQRDRVRKLIDDATRGADREVDFSRYDFAAIYLGARMPEYGMIGLCGYPGMLGWTARGVLKSPGGEALKGMAIFTSQAHLGTLFHDVAHILGGVKDGRRLVPCLYDHDLQAKPGPLREVALDSMINMGFWDPMSCHYIKREIPPPGISSWTKLRLNWLDESKVRMVRRGENANVVLGPLEDGSSQVLAIRIPISSTTYYLVENRQPLGCCDKGLPQSGVLILYADDEVPECRMGLRGTPKTGQ